MYSKNRKLSYSHAINEALHQMMAQDKSVFVIGQGVKSPWYVGNTAKDLLEKFGHWRVIDTPVSENAITGAAVGAAVVGMRPVVVHPRMDFMLYAIDPIINEAANWHYMFGGRSSVPMVIWGIVNRGGEQAAQHSQSLQALFAHIPGLKVVMPSTAYDAKGLMVSAIKDDNPVVYIDDRWLYNVQGNVPQRVYSVPIGKGIMRSKGSDVTLVSVSYMAHESLKALVSLKKQGIKVEFIDLRSVKPLDVDLILSSVRKTGRLVIADGCWKSFGIAAEICALVSENIVAHLKEGIVRVSLPDSPAPSSKELEKQYYPNSDTIIRAIKEMILCRKK